MEQVSADSGKGKHTPGPWEVVDGHLIIANGAVVATVHVSIYSGGSPLQRAANASLIAAAPELLEVTEGALSIVERYASDPVACVRRLQALMPKQCAALTKATGSAS